MNQIVQIVKNELNLLDAILQLMDLPPYEGAVIPTTSDKLADTYYQFLDRVKEYPPDVPARELRPLAEACYSLLRARLGLERKIQKNSE